MSTVKLNLVKLRGGTSTQITAFSINMLGHTVVDWHLLPERYTHAKWALITRWREI